MNIWGVQAVMLFCLFVLFIGIARCIFKVLSEKENFLTFLEITLYITAFISLFLVTIGGRLN